MTVEQLVILQIEEMERIKAAGKRGFFSDDEVNAMIEKIRVTIKTELGV